MKILIADDHQLFRKGLAGILEGHRDIEISGEAADGNEVMAKLAEQQPDMVLLDLHMPSFNGYETCRAILAEYPGIKVLIVTMVDEPAMVQKLLESGASGYFLKNISEEELVSAIYAIANGETVVSTQLDPVLQAFRRAKKFASGFSENELTKREKEILSMIVEGWTNPEIAERIFLSTKTVETHRKNILAKLGIKNTAALVKYAVENKMLLGLDHFSR